MADTYNGWENRETWCAVLHLSNDQGLDEMCEELASSALGDAADAYPRLSLSSGHHSTDGQLEDVVDYLSTTYGATFDLALVTRFPEWETRTMGEGHSSWFDTDAMGVDQEWSSWIIDWIEGDSRWGVFWEDGEPWADPDAGHRHDRAAWIMGDQLRDQFAEWAADVVDGEETTRDLRMMLDDIGSLYRVNWSDVARGYIDSTEESIHDSGHASEGTLVTIFVTILATWFVAQTLGTIVGALTGVMS